MKKKETDLEVKKENEIVEVAADKKKKAKEPKTVAAKKLPSILKKNYTRKKLDRFIKKISIPADKELVQKYFVENPDKAERFYIPRDQQIVKKDFSRLKMIGKDIASHKFGIKILPLAAVVGFIFLVVSTVIAFRNVVARKVIVYAMESTFGAKTDIGYLNLYLTNGKKLGYSGNDEDKWYIGIRINGLEQGYIADPMKNLFEIKESNVSLVLTELTRGKCDIKELKVSGVNVMTSRKTSAYLAKYANEEGKFPLQVALENKAQIAGEAAKEELQKLFEQYNPETMLKNLEAQLQTPTAAKEAYDMGDAMVKKWQTKPEEIAKQVTDFTDKINDLTNTDWSKIEDITVIKTNLEKINVVIQDGKKIAADAKVIVDDVKSDSEKVTVSAKKLTAALDADSKYVQKEVDKIKNFTIDDGINIISGPIDTILYKTIGKYYPYMKKGISIAMQAKASSSGNAAQKVKTAKKEPKHKRMAGVNVYYKGDNVPKFLIERMEFSGGDESVVLWYGYARNISNDMDKRGAPAYAEVKITTNGQNHTGNVTVDARSYTKDPLVAINYSGDNYPIAINTDQFKMNSSSVISGRGTVDDDGSFSIGATLDLKNLQFETERFEPEFAYDLYSRALSYLTELSVGVDFFCKFDESFNMKLTTDADKQFAIILKKLIRDELEILKKECEKRIAELLDEMSKDSNIKINEFIDISNGINAQSLKLDKANALLEEKKKELTERIKNEAAASINNSLGANKEVVEGIGNALQGLDKLKGLKK